MNNTPELKYKYRRWPLFLPAYALFSFIYYLVFFGGEPLGYQAIAETIIMTVGLATFPLIVFFYIKAVRIQEFKTINLELFYAFLISLVFIFLMLLTYIEDFAWFGAIALLFYYLAYYLFWILFSYLIFKLHKRLNK